MTTSFLRSWNVILLEFWVGASAVRLQSYKLKTGRCQNNAKRKVFHRELDPRTRSHPSSGRNRIWSYSCEEKQNINYMQLILSGHLLVDGLTWGTRSCVWRCLGAASYRPPRCDWCRRWLEPAWWSSTKLSDAQTTPSPPLSPQEEPPQSPCTPVNKHRVRVIQSIRSETLPGWIQPRTSWMCSAMRHPATFLSMVMKRKVLVWEGHFVSTCWKPRSLSTISLISSTWETSQKTLWRRLRSQISLNTSRWWTSPPFIQAKTEISKQTFFKAYFGSSGRTRMILPSGNSARILSFFHPWN